ncbi:hypothetical protein OC845_003704 [Tilletia horrida]|nr:hypothetical protein OC845_003704 [Tilletia horrida]
MSEIGGLYDFLYVPFLLPKETVKTLIPPGSTLLPIPIEIFKTFATDPSQHVNQLFKSHHLVAFQLGYQKGTGPLLMPFGMNFSEAKLEVPFVSHPILNKTAAENGESESSEPFLLKQTVIFSMGFMSISANLIAGLKAASAQFPPKGSDAPFKVPADSADSIQYTAEGFLQAFFQPASDGGVAEKETNVELLDALTTLFHSQWFGHRTGKAINRFEYARLSPELEPTAIGKEAEITPRKYLVESGSFNLAKFRGDKGEQSEEIEIPTGTRAWRVRARYRSFVRNL